MPLLPGKKNIGNNIREMQNAGHPHNQAVAAALRTAYGKKRAGGGRADDDNVTTVSKTNRNSPSGNVTTVNKTNRSKGVQYRPVNMEANREPLTLNPNATNSQRGPLTFDQAGSRQPQFSQLPPLSDTDIGPALLSALVSRGRNIGPLAQRLLDEAGLFQKRPSDLEVMRDTFGKPSSPAPTPEPPPASTPSTPFGPPRFSQGDLESFLNNLHSNRPQSRYSQNDLEGFLNDFRPSEPGPSNGTQGQIENFLNSLRSRKMDWQASPEEIAQAYRTPEEIAAEKAKAGGFAQGGGITPPWFIKTEARSMGHLGPLMGGTMGRADQIKTQVPNGSHVIPADVVSGLGDGNSQAGHAKLMQMFPKSMKPAKPIIPKLPTAPKIKFADGGATDMVDVNLSDGEFVVSPEDVLDKGKGDMELGHNILDHFIVNRRNKYMSKLGKLPGPAK